MTRHERFDQQAEDISRQVCEFRENGVAFAAEYVPRPYFQDVARRLIDWSDIAENALNRMREIGEEIEAASQRMRVPESAAPPAPPHAGVASDRGVVPAVRTRDESSDPLDRKAS